jgi:hypothetical protein
VHLQGLQNCSFLATTFCGSTYSTISTLDVLKNGVVYMLSTMFSIHKMSSILAQFQLNKQAKKTNKTNESDNLVSEVTPWVSKA